MKTRMDKYYRDEEIMQRTSKNDSLYDELYRERLPKSNVTVIDNINEIDITKIKNMVDSRSDYKRVRDYEKLIKPTENYKSSEINYSFDEIDYSNYDINEIIKNKRSNKMYDTDPNKVRRITNEEYKILSSIEHKEDDEFSDGIINHEKQLKDLFNTISRTAIDESTDLFSNLKEDDKEDETFYTSTSKFESDDFKEDINENNSFKVFMIIGIIAVLIAIGVIIYIKFFK